MLSSAEVYDCPKNLKNTATQLLSITTTVVFYTLLIAVVSFEKKNNNKALIIPKQLAEKTY